MHGSGGCAKFLICARLLLNPVAAAACSQQSCQPQNEDYQRRMEVLAATQNALDGIPGIFNPRVQVRAPRVPVVCTRVHRPAKAALLPCPLSTRSTLIFFLLAVLSQAYGSFISGFYNSASDLDLALSGFVDSSTLTPSQRKEIFKDQQEEAYVSLVS